MLKIKTASLQIKGVNMMALGIVDGAHLSASDITGRNVDRFGRSVVECFANSINPDFCILGFEGYYKNNVLPDKIMEVYPYEKFKEKYF